MSGYQNLFLSSQNRRPSIQYEHIIQYSVFAVVQQAGWFLWRCKFCAVQICRSRNDWAPHPTDAIACLFHNPMDSLLWKVCLTARASSHSYFYCGPPPSISDTLPIIGNSCCLAMLRHSPIAHYLPTLRLWQNCYPSQPVSLALFNLQISQVERLSSTLRKQKAPQRRSKIF